MYLSAKIRICSEAIYIVEAHYVIGQRVAGHLAQCFSNAGPRPGTGAWCQLYRATSGFTLM